MKVLALVLLFSAARSECVVHTNLQGPELLRWTKSCGVMMDEVQCAHFSTECLWLTPEPTAPPSEEPTEGPTPPPSSMVASEAQGDCLATKVDECQGGLLRLEQHLMTEGEERVKLTGVVSTLKGQLTQTEGELQKTDGELAAALLKTDGELAAAELRITALEDQLVAQGGKLSKLHDQVFSKLLFPTGEPTTLPTSQPTNTDAPTTMPTRSPTPSPTDSPTPEPLALNGNCPLQNCIVMQPDQAGPPEAQCWCYTKQKAFTACGYASASGLTYYSTRDFNGAVHRALKKQFPNENCLNGCDSAYMGAGDCATNSARDNNCYSSSMGCWTNTERWNRSGQCAQIVRCVNYE